ncbi:hypothetical protein JDW15_08715 [Aerococcaceae bacterium zg-ZJ1578]|uniref:hypothetical protein n=1 Tax=Aerococcaceae bacterium zg-252 TaxID=2796928 RepID=UPI001A32F7DB|nr:hypothetical protein [Aerococcaceae bacterium zg-1578]
MNHKKFDKSILNIIQILNMRIVKSREKYWLHSSSSQYNSPYIQDGLSGVLLLVIQYSKDNNKGKLIHDISKYLNSFDFSSLRHLNMESGLLGILFVLIMWYRIEKKKNIKVKILKLFDVLISTKVNGVGYIDWLSENDTILNEDVQLVCKYFLLVLEEK